MVGVVAELRAEATDIDAKVVHFVEVLPAPDLGEEGAVLEDVAGVAYEVVEELVLGGGQVEPRARSRASWRAKSTSRSPARNDGARLVGGGISWRRRTARTRARSSRWLNGFVT